MKYTGIYDSVSCEYDIDHEISRNVEHLKTLIYDIDDNNNIEHKKTIIKAMISELMDQI